MVSSGKTVNTSAVLIDSRGQDHYGGYRVVDGVYLPTVSQSNPSYFDSMTVLNLPGAWLVVDLEAVFCVEGVKIWPRYELTQPSRFM